MSATEPLGFKHRILTGWISEYVNRALPGEWPQIPLDAETIGDFESYFDLCADCGYTDVVVWGFFADRRWPLDVSSCLDDDRRRRIQRVVDEGRSRGLRVLGGLGIYSWGFDAIIKANPHLSRTNERAMCPSVVEAWEWMQRVLDVVLGEVDCDGLNMQSADQGRCDCPDCKGLSTVAYHAQLNERVTEYIRTKWPGKFLIVDNWGCPFDDTSDLPVLTELSARVDCIFDHNNSSAKAGDGYRGQLSESLSCSFGTLAGTSIWPPQRWEPDRWFIPLTELNVPYVRALHADGARAAEQFVTTLANPSGEVSLRFMGKLLKEVGADSGTLLRASVEETFEPNSEAVLDGLVDVVRAAERAYVEHSCRDLTSSVGLINLDGGLMPKEDPSPETYLLDMSPEHLDGYIHDMTAAAKTFDQVAEGIGREGIAEVTAACFRNGLADAERIRGQRKDSR